MTNLLKETEQFMIKKRLSWNDVDFIGGHSFSISIENFRDIAGTANYESGYGMAEVAEDLVIVFKDGSWMERFEYDGSEGWTLKHVPRNPGIEIPVNALTIHQCPVWEYGWVTLEGLNLWDDSPR